ncbi:MAG TPA: UPF0182 family protein, partial [Gemmatimonadaceae bacterium]|nr:UPF0182 family protein [Gemmatimonadaceae bacterium]
MGGGRRLALAVAVGAALLLAGRLLAAVWADYAWYAALGAGALWRAKAVNAMLLHGGTTVLGTAVLVANLWAVRHSIAKLVLPRRVGNIEIGEEVPPAYLLGAILILSFATGALLALAQGSWTTLALARYGRAFAEIDPYFARDLSFYVAWLPLERSYFVWAQLTLVVVTVLVVILYALTPSLRWERGTLRVSPHVRRHFAVLGALMLLLLAWSYRLDRYLLLVDGGVQAGLYGWVDHQVARPAAAVLSMLTTASAVLVLWAGFTGQVRMAFGVVTTVLVLALTLQEIIPALAPRLASGPALEVRNRPYLGTRELYVRRAFGVDRIAVLDSAPGVRPLDAQVSDVPLWDPGAVRATLERGAQRAEMVGPVGWRGGAGGLEALAVVREPLGDSLARWSVARALATRADAEGQVRRGLPVELRALAPPLVHPGARGYLVVPDTAGQIAAPLLAGRLARLALAWSVQNLRLVGGELPAVRPRLLQARDVRERVARIAPGFVQGATVSPLTAADSLYWVMPLYAASRTYPLSLPFAGGGREWTYFHFAATAVVNARTGRVTLVPTPRPDPVASSWIERFPTLFGSWAQFPAELPARLPPAIDGARAQLSALGRVGTGTRRFAARQLASPAGEDSVLADAAPVLLGDGARPLRWTVPLVDEGDRVVGLATASGGGEPTTSYAPFTQPGPRWSVVRERLRRPPDQA